MEYNSQAERQRTENTDSIVAKWHYPMRRGAELVFHPYLQLHHDKPWLARLTDRINRWVDQDVPAAMASRHDY